MFIADFHIHTNLSDGKLSMQEVVDLYGNRGFGAIAITDHLCESGSAIGKVARYLGCSLTEKNFDTYVSMIEEEAVRAWKKYRMLVIPGVEFTKNFVSNHKSAHVLALGLREFISPCLDIPELCAAVREKNALSIAAHPVSTRKWEKQTYRLWNQRHEYSQCFDAWEVASGPHIFTEVLHSGLPMIANSDLHVAKQMTSWKTIFHCEKNERAIFEAIRKQDLQFQFYRDAVSEESQLLALTDSLLPAM